MGSLSPQLRSLRDAVSSVLSEACGWVSSELEAAASAYAPTISGWWSALRESHQHLSATLEQSVRVTPEGAVVVALLPYLAALRIALWAARPVLSTVLTTRISLDPVAWIRQLARMPLRLPQTSITDIWGRWFFPQRTNRIVVERALALARQQHRGTESVTADESRLTPPPLMSAADAAELTENHGLVFESPVRWRGHLQTNLPLDTAYWLDWNGYGGGCWTVRVEEPGLLARGIGSACWSSETDAYAHWYPEEALPGTSVNAVAVNASFLAMVRAKHREFNKPARGSFFSKRRTA